MYWNFPYNFRNTEAILGTIGIVHVEEDSHSAQCKTDDHEEPIHSVPPERKRLYYYEVTFIHLLIMKFKRKQIAVLKLCKNSASKYILPLLMIMK